MLSTFLVIFGAVFLAELGDKTQLAALMFSAEGKASPWVVFLAACGALIASTAIAVALGSLADRFLSALPLGLISGIGFVLIGTWMIWSHLRGA